MLDEGVSRLIGRIYEGVQSPESLQGAADALMDRIGGAFGLIAVAECERPSFSRVQWLNRLGPLGERIADEYQGEMQPLDPVFTKVNGQPGARLFDSFLDVPAELHSTHPYMKWAQARFGSTHWMLAYTPPSASLSFGMSVQPHAGGQFGAEDRALFRLVFDHMERAFTLAARPPLAGGGQAAMIVGVAGDVTAANESAWALLRRGDGLGLANGRLLTEHRPSQAGLLRLLRSALAAVSVGGRGGAAALPRGSGLPPLIVSVTPNPAEACSLAAFYPGALVRVTDPAAAPPLGLAAQLRLLFRLTAAEARLAEALLANDGNLRNVAATCGIAYATARAQLASIFEKTGTHSQALLIRLLAGIAATIPAA